MTNGSQTRNVFINTSTAWMASAIGMVVGFLLTPFLLKRLGNELYGLYRIADNIAAWCCFAVTPIGTYASRFAMIHYERGEHRIMNQILSTSFIISVIAGAIITIPLLICAGFPDKLLGMPLNLIFQARVAIFIVGFGAIAALIIRVWESAIFMSQRFYLKHFQTIASRVIGAIIIVAYFMYVGPSLSLWLVTVIGLPLIVTLTFVIPIARRDLPMQVKPSWYQPRQARTIWRFLGVYLVGGIGSQLFDATDSLVIINMSELGVSEVAAYDIGARWLYLIRPLIDAYIIANSPSIVANVARNNKENLIAGLINGTRRSILIGLIPVLGLVAVAKPLIISWVGAEYLPRSVPVMWIMLSTTIAMIPTMYAYHVLIALAEFQGFALAAMTSGVLNLFLSIILVRYFNLGLAGVAFGTLIAAFLGNTLYMPFIACRKCGLKMHIYLKKVWFKPLLTVIVYLPISYATLQYWFPRSLPQVLLSLSFQIIICLGAIWIVGLSGGERSEILIMLKKHVRNRLKNR